MGGEILLNTYRRGPAIDRIDDQNAVGCRLRPRAGGVVEHEAGRARRRAAIYDQPVGRRAVATEKLQPRCLFDQRHRIDAKCCCLCRAPVPPEVRPRGLAQKVGPPRTAVRPDCTCCIFWTGGRVELTRRQFGANQCRANRALPVVGLIERDLLPDDLRTLRAS